MTLRAQQNEFVTRTGPGTPMGEMFRRYWTPVLLAEELPANDCPPVRVKILSERLVAFRDSLGRYGLIDEFCAHRGVSLWFGRNEECGLRCPYHGWKFDFTGQCIEVPSEPEESGFARKIKLKSYPLVERGGVLWTYMGRRAAQAAAAGMGIRHGAAGAALRLQAPAGEQLAAGDGRRHRFEPRLLPASRQHQLGSAVQGRQGQSIQSQRRAAGVRGGREPGRPLYRGPPQCRGGQLLLAHHPMGHAVVHHDPAARRSFGARPLLDPDRRRELLGLELRLSSDPGAHRRRARSDAARARASMCSICPAPIARSPTRTTTI